MKNKLFWAKAKEDVIIPTKRDEDAGYDIYANLEEEFVTIKPHETKLIPTRLHCAFPSGYVLILKERGSTGTKGMGQRAGIVDSGYRGEIFVPITNHNNVSIIIAKKNVVDIDGGYLFTKGKGMIGTTDDIIYPYEKAICQAILFEIPQLESREIPLDELLAIESERGQGMLGDSGK